MPADRLASSWIEHHVVSFKCYSQCGRDCDVEFIGMQKKLSKCSGSATDYLSMEGLSRIDLFFV